MPNGDEVGTNGYDISNFIVSTSTEFSGILPVLTREIVNAEKAIFLAFAELCRGTDLDAAFEGAKCHEALMINNFQTSTVNILAASNVCNPRDVHHRRSAKQQDIISTIGLSLLNL